MNNSTNVIGSVLTSKSVLLPIVVGCITMAFTSGIPFFIGAAAAAMGVATAIARLTSRKSTTDQGPTKLRSQHRREHGAYLRELQGKLRQDEDSRTGELLKAIRELFKRIEELGIGSQSTEKTWMKAIAEQVDELYRSCLDGLEKSYALWQEAKRVNTPDLKDRLLKQREELVEEVEKSVQHLGKSLDQVQVSSSSLQRPDNDLGRLRDELDQGLEVARKVEQRVSELDREIRKATRE